VIEARNITIERLFGKDNNKELIYKIPPYQRAYSWKKEQCENLFNDILDNEEGYFLGSIICIGQENYYSVVDGQQRITTLSLLFNALLSVINDYDSQHPDEKILDNRRNEDYADSWSKLKKFLYLKNIGKRLTLSIQNGNDIDYNYLLDLSELTKNTQKPDNFSQRRLNRTYKDFRERLLDEEFTIKKIFNFYDKLASAFIVKIDVADEASAFTLFESINNRGIPLTPIDLIKNTIIGRMAELNEKADKINEDWQIIVKNIETYSDQIRFLRHFYHAFQKNPKIKVPKYTKATKTNIIKIYPALIKDSSDIDVDNTLKELIEKSNIYSTFISPDTIKTDNQFHIYRHKLKDLERLGVAPSYSLLLYIFSIHSKDDLEPLLNFLENWFMRRNLTNYPSTNKLDQMFLDLINKIYGEDYSFGTIKEYMTTGDYYLDDIEFEKWLIEKPLYDISSSAIRCLLIKLEKSKRTNENKVDFWETTGTKKQKMVWSVEHILPQEPKETSDWFKIFTTDEHKQNLHRLGNLTLTRYNSTLYNSEFEKKIEAKNKEGQNIGLKSGDIKISEYIKDKDDAKWTKKDIDARSQILATEVIELLNSDK